MKKRIIIISFILLFISVFTLSTYAIYQAVYRKYPVTITTTNVTFKYNNKTYIDEISTDNLELVKGIPQELTMTVTSEGSSNLIVDYYLSFNIEEKNKSDAIYSQENMVLANAIDVYFFNGNRYEYVSKLADLKNITQNNSIFKGVLFSNNPESLKIQLIYSNETNIEFDNAAKSKIVKISSFATASDLTTHNYQFVSSEKELIEAMKRKSPSQIYFTKDISLTKDISTSVKHGIDLNGFNLNLGGNIIYDYTVDDEVNDNIYIGDKTGNGKIITANNAKIKIMNDDVFYVDNPYSDFVIYQLSTVPTGLNSIIENRMGKLSNIKEYCTNEDFPVLDGLWVYKKFFNVASDVLELDESNKTIKIKSSISETAYYRYRIRDLYSSILIRGNSLQSIFESIKNQYKGLLVSSTINFKSFDAVTGAHIEYIVYDNHDGNILNDKGIYQANGNDYAYNLSKIEIIRPIIYVAITKGNEMMRFPISSEDSIKLMPLTNSQIVNLLIDTDPKFFISNNTERTYDSFLSDFKNKVDSASVTSVDLALDSPVHDNLSVIDNKIKFSNVGNNKIYNTSLIVSINYSISNEEFSGKSLINTTVIGEESYVTRYDISNRLNAKFNENDYITGKSYTFNVYGALSPSIGGKKTTIYVKYNVKEDNQSYVSIIYKFIEALEIESQVAYFLKSTNDNYNFIDTDDRNIINLALGDKNFLFVKLTDGDNYDGIRYSILNDNAVQASDGEYALLYSRVGVVNIVTANAPQAESTRVELTAELYKNMDFSGGVYDSSIEPYKIAFPVEGIVNYGQENGQIKNINLYNSLLDCFDQNNDGVITYSEAHADIKTVKATLNLKNLTGTYIANKKCTRNKKDYINIDYLKFDNIALESLSGIENFSNIDAFSFNNCGITDLSNLRTIHGLRFLSANNNTITNVEPLNLLDNLEYLDLSNNIISTIDDLAHLSNLKYINFNNNKLVDFNALNNMTTIRELFLCGMSSSGGTAFDQDYIIAYQLALVMTNCVNDNYPATIKIGSGSGKVFNLDENSKAAVKVLKQFEEINRISQSLYLPANYIDSNGNTFNVSWITDNPLISISKDVENGCYQYTITSPIIDTKINIIASINGFNYQRSLKVTVLKTDMNNVYIYYDNKYVNILNYPNLIPDSRLQNALFNSFNSINDDTIVEGIDSDGNAFKTTEKYVLSLNDYKTGTVGGITSLNWSNMGITSLKGIDKILMHFVKKDLDLNLEGNLIEEDDLALLDGTISILRLGGKKYNFMSLIDDSAEKIMVKLNLKELHVSQCYGLDDEDILKGLFWLYFYTTGDFKIYTDNSNNPWDPYAPLLDKKMTSLPMTYTFSKTCKVNIFNNEGLYENNLGIPIEFYGIKHYFKPNDVNIYTRLNNGNLSYSYGVLSYNKLYACNETAYLYTTLISNTKKQLSYEYVIQLNFEDQSENIRVINLDNKKISELFGSIELKETLITKFYTTLNSSTKVYSIDAVTDNNQYYYDKNLGIHYINKEFLQKLDITSITMTGASSNTDLDPIYGLRYLPKLTTLEVKKDFNAGDGSDLVNLTTIKAELSLVDFTKLREDLVLDKLNTLIVQYFDGFVINKTIGDQMPNLTSLFINMSDHRNIDGSEQDYFNLSDLLYFINKDNKHKIKNLFLNKVVPRSGGKFRPFSNGDIENIIIPLINSYEDGANKISDLIYIIGTPNSNAVAAANDNNNPNVSVGDPLGTINSYNGMKLIFTNEDNNLVVSVKSGDTTYSWSTKGIPADNSTINKFDKFEDTNNKVFDNYVRYTDLGLKINGANWNTLNANKQINITKGTTLSLPRETGLFLFGFSDNENGSDMKNSYNITWYMWKKTKSSFISKTELSSEDDYINYNCDNDEYILLVGTFNGKLNGSTTDYIFIYQFVVGDGDGIYNLIENDNLRMWAFINAECANSTDVLSFKTNFSISYSPSVNDFTNSAYEIKSYSKILLGKDYSWGSSYNSIITVSSISDLDKSDVKSYLVAKFQYKTILDLSNTDFTDNSFFGELKNITTLNLADSKFNIVDFNGYNKLEKLYLENNKNITPAIFTNLPKTIKVLDVNGTKCDSNRDTFTNLDNWLSDNSELKLKVNGNNGTVTKNKILEFNNHIDSVKPDNSNIHTEASSFNNLYKEGKVTGEINNVKYDLSWPLYKTFKEGDISGKNILPSGQLTVTVLYSQPNTVFANIPLKLTFNTRTSDTSYFKIGANDKKSLSELNYELIAICYENKAISIDKDGYFILNKNVEINDINAMKCISANFDNFIIEKNSDYLKLKLSNDYGIILRYNDSYNNLYDYDNNRFQYKYTEYNKNDSSYGIKSTKDELNKLKITFKEENFDFTDANKDGNEVIKNIYLAKYIFIDGEAYPLKIEPSNKNMNLIKTDNLNNQYIYLNSASFIAKDIYTSSYTFKLYIEDGKYLNSNNSVLTVSLRGAKSDYEKISSYNLYVEVKYDSINEEYYILTNAKKNVNDDNPDKIIFNKNNPNIIKATLFKEESISKNLNNGSSIKKSQTFKILNDESNVEPNKMVYLIKGSEIFVSGRMQYALIGDYMNYFKLVDKDENRIGTVLSDYAIEITNKFEYCRNSKNAIAITSIEGVQIFRNMTEFNFDGGNFHSIEALRGLNLTLFRYGTSDTNSYTIVEDFSPLIEGSINTLTSFEYATRSNSFVTDLSFLLCFKKLKVVKIFTDAIQGSAYRFVQLPNFMYFVDALNKKGVKLYVYKDILTNGKSEVIKKYFNITNEGNLRLLSLKAEYSETIRILNLFDIPSYYKDSPTLSNDYLLSISKNKVIEDGYYIYLPATIIDKGKVYLLNYETSSILLENVKYYLKTKDGFSEFTGDINDKINSNTFYTDQLSETEVLYVGIKIAPRGVEIDKFTNCGYIKVNMRVLVSLGEKSYYAVRTFTIQLTE